MWFPKFLQIGKTCIEHTAPKLIQHRPCRKGGEDTIGQTRYDTRRTSSFPPCQKEVGQSAAGLGISRVASVGGPSQRARSCRPWDPGCQACLPPQARPVGPPSSFPVWKYQQCSPWSNSLSIASGLWACPAGRHRREWTLWSYASSNAWTWMGAVNRGGVEHLSTITMSDLPVPDAGWILWSLNWPSVEDSPYPWSCHCPLADPITG